MAYEIEQKEAQEELSVLDILLGCELPNVKKQLPTAQYKVKRLSKMAGKPVVFALTGLSYDKIETIQKENSKDVAIHILLAGITAPDFKSKALLEKYSAVTPVDVVKSMLLAGEIEDLSRAVEKLCGYRGMTITEIKNG